MDQEIRDKVIETHTMMKGVNARLKKIDDNQEDHDKRLRKQETFRTWILGLFSTGVVGGGTLATVKQIFFTGGS